MANENKTVVIMSQFLTEYDENPTQNVNDFLDRQLQKENPELDEGQRKEAVSHIITAVADLAELHRDLRQWEQEGKARVSWIQQKMDAMCADKKISKEQGYSLLSSIACQQNIQLVESLSKEKLEADQKEWEMVPDTQSISEVRKSVVEVNNLSATLSTGVVAEGIVQGIEEAEQSVSTVIASPTLVKALTSDYLSDEEIKAKKLTAGAIYSSLSKDRNTKISQEEQKREKESRPLRAALTATSSINACKVSVRIANAENKSKEAVIAEKFVQQGVEVGCMSAARYVFGKVGAVIGAACGVVVNFLGVPIPIELTTFAGKVAGRCIAGTIPAMTTAVKKVAQKITEVTVTGAKAVAKAVKPIVQNAVDSVKITAKKVTEYAREAVTSFASGVKKTVTTGVKKAVGWLCGIFT